jgi:peptide/nickel transport system permease protein
MTLNDKSIKKIRKSSYWVKSWDRFTKNKLAIFGFIIFLFIAFLGISAPYLPIQDPMKQNWGDERIPPSSQYWFGTDNLGRDTFSRVVWGARTSLIIGFEAVSIMTLIGVVLGSISGYYGKVVDTLTMRSTDIFLSIPRLVLLIVIASVLRIRSIYFTGFIIGITDWPAMTRLVRSNFLSLKEQTFVESAKSVGVKDRSIIFKHILPNTLSPIIVIATIQIGTAIMIEAGLSFLGLGDPFIISWGQMLAVGNSMLRNAWWNAFFPGLFVFIAVLGFNLLGDGLRDALDVRM